MRDQIMSQPRHTVNAKVLMSSKAFSRRVGKKYCVTRITEKVSALYRASWELRRGSVGNCSWNISSSQWFYKTGSKRLQRLIISRAQVTLSGIHLA